MGRFGGTTFNEWSEVQPEIEEPEVTIPTPTEPEEIAPLTVDSDGDGLTDAQELEYGTNPDLVDTDRDDLTDREEIFVWETDPLDPDSDGDTYLDGQEVQNGYNPNGPGTLQELP